MFPTTFLQLHVSRPCLRLGGLKLVETVERVLVVRLYHVDDRRFPTVRLTNTRSRQPPSPRSVAIVSTVFTPVSDQRRRGN